MIWMFLAAAIFGFAFVIPMLLGGLDTEIGDGVDLDLDGPELDVDLDVEPGVEVETGTDFDAEVAGADPLGAVFASLVSFRSIVFFSAFFGASGLVFGALGYSSLVTTGTAVLIGGVAATANALLFGLLRTSQANSQISDRTLEGRPASVVLPIEAGHRGRIRIDLSGQPQYLVARSYDERSEQEFGVGASVVVVRVENGTAPVASLAELDPGEE